MEKLICPGCYELLKRVQRPVCLKCGCHIDDETGEYCRDCRNNEKSFERNLALLEYSSPVTDRIIWNLKYNNKREFADFLALEIAVRFGKELLSWGCDAVIPVPVHPQRRRERGYNQAEVLAKRLSELLEIKCDPHALRRVRKTVAQKKLDARARSENLQTAFVSQDKLKYGSVLLVDDIYTTGATLEGCTRALKRAGVKKVFCVTCCVGRNT